jgi:hypothetical protein
MRGKGVFTKQRVAAIGTVAGSAGLILMGTLLASPRVPAADDEHSSSDESRIEVGLHIAPVHLVYAKHDRKLVGLGSYLVNAVIGCNGCHSAGTGTEYADHHNPYQRLGPLGPFTPPKIVNPVTYLGGGRDFLQIGPITSPTVPPHIVSRNLTPDETGIPAGGFAEFFDSLRNGLDHDHLHPNCNGTTITTNCFNPPFNGDLLQVMPWPSLQELTDHDLHAMYTYLTAIPCVVSPGHSCS